MSHFHFLINEAPATDLAASSWTCAECKSCFPVEGEPRYAITPVRHCMQQITCPECRAYHVVLSAGSKADCVAIEPELEKLAEKLRQLMRVRRDH